MATLVDEIEGGFVILDFDFEIFVAREAARRGNDFANFIEIERITLDRSGAIDRFDTGAVANGNFDFGEDTATAEIILQDFDLVKVASEFF